MRRFPPPHPTPGTVNTSVPCSEPKTKMLLWDRVGEGWRLRRGQKMKL